MKENFVSGIDEGELGRTSGVWKPGRKLNQFSTLRLFFFDRK